MNEDPPNDNRTPDPLFDGHLERPVEKMTIEERLRWIDEGARLLHWARQAKRVPIRGRSRMGGPIMPPTPRNTE